MNILLILFIFKKILTSFLLKFWVLSGAKVDKSIRSRKMLQNEYLVAKIGVDTAENEPPKNWGKFFIISILSLLSNRQSEWPFEKRDRLWKML